MTKKSTYHPTKNDTYETQLATNYGRLFEILIIL